MRNREFVRHLLALAAGVLLTAVASPTATATERHVPGQYPTIQQAIDACVAGDVVVVADGVYSGPGNTDMGFWGLAITVRSANGPESCTIDGQGTATSAFGFWYEEGPDSVLDGFTIRNMRSS